MPLEKTKCLEKWLMGARESRKCWIMKHSSVYGTALLCDFEEVSSPFLEPPFPPQLWNSEVSHCPEHFCQGDVITTLGSVAFNTEGKSCGAQNDASLSLLPRHCCGSSI